MRDWVHRFNIETKEAQRGLELVSAQLASETKVKIKSLQDMNDMHRRHIDTLEARYRGQAMEMNVLRTVQLKMVFYCFKSFR